MRYFLRFCLNLGYTTYCASVLLIISNFSFLSIGHSFPRTSILHFWQEYMSILFEIHTNFICNPIQINDREKLHIKFRTTWNSISEKKFHKRTTKVLEKKKYTNSMNKVSIPYRVPYAHVWFNSRYWHIIKPFFLNLRVWKKKLKSKVTGWWRYNSGNLWKICKKMWIN